MTIPFSHLSLLGLLACGSPDIQLTKFYPDITVAPNSVDFGDVVKLYEVGTEIQILNAGRAPLEIISIELVNQVHANEGTVFVVNGDPVELAADDVLTVTLGFTPTEYLAYSADLIIESNDEDNPVISVPIGGAGIVGSTPDIDIHPRSIAFAMPGSVETSTSGQFTISNTGDGPLSILDAVFTGPDVFTLVTNPVGQQITQGTDKLVVVEYNNPDPLASGHTGLLTIQSTDPDEAEVPIVLIGGDGGGGYNFPVAVIDCAAIGEVNPPDVIIMDGTDSYDPKDTDGTNPVSYEWSLTYKPDESVATIDFPTDPAFEMRIDLAGTYQVQLVVTDSNGLSSDPTTCAINAIPAEDLYIVLSWNKPSTDVDLHVVPEDSEDVNCKYFGCCDCFFGNKVPDIWTTEGFGECVYALDAQDGYGPENVNVENPDDREYHIRVHYWKDYGDIGDLKATIRVHVNKDPEPIAILTEDLSYNNRWNVGYVNFVDGVGTFVDGTGIDDNASTRSFDSTCSAP